ncbi:cytochrome c oxidase subunit II [Candidatus Acetothermia bacterium]|nr:cytochrome c oxidase subunit II [Candidatus Acetothermia bacterium]MBI3644249.1 cytochrome c oxidase subunit II [Candidatus Acetothermia bacterium]
MPPAASTISIDVDNIYYLILAVTSFFFFLVVFLLIYFIIKYRAKKPGEEGINFHGHMGLEIVWTIVPAVIFIIIAIYSAEILQKIDNVPADAMVINVTGEQFIWHFEYAADGVKSDKIMHVPLNKPIVLNIEAKDVIHSFWVPAFRIKQDALPHEQRETWFQARLTGEFPIRCAELCGPGHSQMLGTVIVETETQFAAWIQEEKEKANAQENALSDSAKRGLDVIQHQGCMGCHTIDGSKLVGPTWLGLYGKTETLDDGSQVKVDEAYILESIRDPNAKVVNAFPAIMPTFGPEKISDDQIKDVLEYIESLGTTKSK